MKFVSFNINGLRARPHQLEAIVEKHQPDVIGLQETKVHDDMFPVSYTHLDVYKRQTYDNIDDYLEGKNVPEQVARTIENWYLKTEHKRRPPITVFDDFWKK